MKIYLAGKVSQKLGAWRDDILLGSRWCERQSAAVPWWHLPIASDHSADYPRHRVWPQEENTAVLGLHNYVGPYLAVPVDALPHKNGGVFHGNPGWGSHGEPDQDFRGIVASECMDAIHRADFVFAYLNSPDCFGTLVEIGYARALGKYVHLALADDASWEWHDYWFTAEIADDVSHVYAPSHDDDSVLSDPGVTVIEAFRNALLRWTAAPHRPTMATQEAPTVAMVSEAGRAFGSIAKWTSDPRVRNEAERMLRTLSGSTR